MNHMNHAEKHGHIGPIAAWPDLLSGVPWSVPGACVLPGQAGHWRSDSIAGHPDAEDFLRRSLKSVRRVRFRVQNQHKHTETIQNYNFIAEIAVKSSIENQNPFNHSTISTLKPSSQTPAKAFRKSRQGCSCAVTIALICHGNSCATCLP